jgi:superfamily II DNA or RNA helicase
LGDGQTTTYKLWGSRNIPIPKEGFNGVLFCGIQKLQSVRQNQPELFEQITKDARLIIFDEAHKAAANETRQLVESLMCTPPGYEDRSLVGLTATPCRTTLTSDENKLLSNMFENRLIGIDVSVVNQVNMSQDAFLNHIAEDNAIKYFQNARILSKIKKEQLTYTEQFTPQELQKIKTAMLDNGYVDFSKTALEVIGRNRSRNKAILDKLRQLSTEQVPTIVFACSVAHAKLLSFMLSLEDIPNTLVLGEMNPIDRAEAITSFKDRENPVNILINYEVLTTGFDSTNIRCVFITRPTQSVVLYSQMLGRGLRGPMMGGNAECLLVDIKDNLGRYDADMAFSHFDAYWS